MEWGLLLKIPHFRKLSVAKGDVKKNTTAVKKTWLLKNKESTLQIAKSIFLEFYTEFLEIDKKTSLLTMSVERIDFMQRIINLLD